MQIYRRLLALPRELSRIQSRDSKMRSLKIDHLSLSHNRVVHWRGLTHLCVTFIIQIWRVSSTHMVTTLSVNECVTSNLVDQDYFICEANFCICLPCLDSPLFLLKRHYCCCPLHQETGSLFPSSYYTSR